MPNQLSHALASAGLISSERVEKEARRTRTQASRRTRKEQRSLLQETDRDEQLGSWSSLSEFMEGSRKRLMEEGYSPELLKRIAKDGHRFCDIKGVSQRNRNRMHAFFTQLQEALDELDKVRQKRILREGKKAFKDMNLKRR